MVPTSEATMKGQLKSVSSVRRTTYELGRPSSSRLMRVLVSSETRVIRLISAYG